MAYAIYITDSDGRQKITSVYPTSEAATAAVDAAKGETVFAGELIDDVEPGWYLDVNGPRRAPPLTVAEAIVEHRDALRVAWRERESEFRAAWAAHTADKATDYQRWVEMNCRAVAVDANLSDSTLLAVLQTEAEIDGREWHIQHSPTLWAAIWPDASASPPRTWVYHSTAAGTDRHSRGCVENTDMAMTTDADFDYVEFLHGG